MPSWAGLQRDGSRYGLAILCIAGPMLVGTLAPDLALRALLPCAPKTLADLQSSDAWRACAPAAANFRLDLRPSAAVRSDRDTTAPSAATKSAQTADEIERLDPQHRDVLLGARDVEGRVRYVVASAFLFAASLAAFCFGAAVVVRRRGSLPVWAPWAVIAVFASFAFWLTFHSAGFERIRPLIVEAILRASDDKQAWHTADRVLFLVRFNTWVALVAVGTLLAALYAASVRAVDREPDLDDLLRRREIAHWVLGFGSTLLVIAVFASEILVDWPASLLAKPQQAALKPLGEALTLLLGAVGTIALFAAMAPALAAYVLDVRRYRARTTVWFVEPEPRPAAQPSVPAKKPAQPADDALGFAPVPVMSAVVAAFAPLLASSLLQVMKTFLL